MMQVLTLVTVSDPASEHHVKHPGEFEKLENFLRSTYADVFDKLTTEKVGPSCNCIMLPPSFWCDIALFINWHLLKAAQRQE